MLLSLAALALLPGCRTPEERAVELVEAMADAFERHGEGDCAALGDELDALLRREAEAIEALAESDRSEASRKRSAPYRRRMDAALDRIVSRAAACGAEPRVQRALERIL